MQTFTGHLKVILFIPVLIILSSATVSSAQVGTTILTTQTPETWADQRADYGQLELGTRFKSTKGGYVTAIRHWKVSGDNGNHWGRLWTDSGGTPLAIVQFSGETDSGWQEQALIEPVAIRPNQVYTVSANHVSVYPVTWGGLSSPITNESLQTAGDGPNGVLGALGTFPVLSSSDSNYFRDVRFVMGSTINRLSGNDQATPLGSQITNPLVVELRDENWLPLSDETVEFSIASGDGTLTKVSGTTDSKGRASAYVITGDTSGAISVLATTASIGSVRFTVNAGSNIAEAPGTVMSTQVPPEPYFNDGSGFELGMKFYSVRRGRITAIRFYQAPGDSGVHVGRIWDASSQTILATSTFTGETGSGWQQVSLATPLSIQADTSYVVTVNTNSDYVASRNGFYTDITNGYLRANAGAPNGLYGGSGNFGSFPTNSYMGNNYYRDIVFEPDTEMIKTSGDYQSGSTNSALLQPLSVRIVDSTGAGQANLTVNFQITTGNGNLSQVSTLTNLNGDASTSLILGPNEETIVIEALAPGFGSTTFIADAYLDHIPPNAPIISIPSNQTYLSDTTPSFTGTAEPGSVVSLFRDTILQGTILANQIGAWTFTPSAPWTENSYSITASARDIANNTSSISEAIIITVDITPPSIPTILLPVAGSALSSTTPTISGSADPNTALVLRLDGVVQTSLAVGGEGTWSFTPSSNLSVGPHQVSAISRDAAGNESSAALSREFLVDTEVARPVIIAPTNGTTVSAKRPTIAGIAEPNSTITLFSNGTLIAEVLTASWGLWSYTAGEDWSDGIFILTAKAKDLANNLSSLSLGISLTIDTTPPDPPHVAELANQLTLEQGDSITLHGTAEPGTVVYLTINGHNVANVLVSSTGQWTYVLSSPASPGVATIAITSMDQAGNISSVRTGQIVVEDETRDSDGDGVDDRQEESDGTDPNDRGSFHQPMTEPICASWNTYLDSWIVAEHLNTSNSLSRIEGVLHDNSGTVLQGLTAESKEDTQRLKVPGYGQVDTLLSSPYGSEKPGYGIYCPTVLQGTDAMLRGGIVQYLPSWRNSEDGRKLTFAYQLSFAPGILGRQSVQLNTWYPSFLQSDGSGSALNWIQITNMEDTSEKGSAIFYTDQGEVAEIITVKLPPKGRQDLSGHIPLGNDKIGLVEWVPNNSARRFELINLRQIIEDNSQELRGLMSLTGRSGTGRPISVPLAKTGHTRVIEIANVISERIKVSIQIRSKEGNLINIDEIPLRAHQSRHLVLDDQLDGTMTFKSNQPESLLATLIAYQGSDHEPGFSVYSIPAEETIGEELFGSYNTYLGQTCELLLLNSQNEQTTVTISVYAPSLSAPQTTTLKVPSLGLLTNPLCQNLKQDSYGLIKIHPDQPNAISATLLRKSSDNQVIFATKLAP